MNSLQFSEGNEKLARFIEIDNKIIENAKCFIDVSGNFQLDESLNFHKSLKTLEPIYDKIRSLSIVESVEIEVLEISIKLQGGSIIKAPLQKKIKFQRDFIDEAWNLAVTFVDLFHNKKLIQI